jgi:hypothetical protein
MMKTALGICALLVALTPPAMAQQQSALDSPGAFVQRFYNSYVKREAPRWGRTVQIRRGLFEPSLSAALQAEAAAQAKAKGEIVGLDFDPFLGSQDPGEAFTVRRVTDLADGARVEVHDQAFPGKPMVLVDVVPRGGSWVINNIRYPRTSSDLRALLNTAKQNRQRR